MYKNFRYEFKYIINNRLVEALEFYLEKVGLKKDASQNGYYTVTSLYFDTPALDDYHDKISGLKYRRKLRARVYNDNFYIAKNVWLEIKEKHDMNINKMRASIEYDDWMYFLKIGNTFKIGNKYKENKIIQKFLYLFHIKNYRPHIVVKYTRKVFIADFLSGIRVTIDRNLETCAWKVFMDNGEMSDVYRGEAVLEVKFTQAIPWWFGNMLKQFQLSRQSFSKYTNSVDMLNKHKHIAR